MQMVKVITGKNTVDLENRINEYTKQWVIKHIAMIYSDSTIVITLLLEKEEKQ